MEYKMSRSLKPVAAGLILLITMGTAQAAPMPTPDFSFGTLGPGTQSASAFLPGSSPNVRWFEFMLDATSFVDLSTSDPNSTGPEDSLDTELALYAASGTDNGKLLGENDDCASGVLTSCLSFANLGAGTYLAAIVDWPGIFADEWEVSTSNSSDAEVVLDVTVRQLSAVPVPAAIWLFGSALIGFVGMSRKTSVRA